MPKPVHNTSSQPTVERPSRNSHKYHPHKYHHGDLRAELLREASLLLAEDGIEKLSLRRLAERCGVSRSAPYHHFKDKHELLCAIACEGFLALEGLMQDMENQGGSRQEQLRHFVLAYLHFACDAPERYDLMFGRQIWKLSHPTSELREVAFRTFRLYANALTSMFRRNRLPEGSQPLRLAQASWATLHGLCRLLIDGIYVNRGDMEEVATEAMRLMQVRMN
jgi:AcrR family transcriptional regulator